MTEAVIKILIPISTFWNSLPQDTEHALNSITNERFTLKFHSTLTESVININFEKIKRTSLKIKTDDHPALENYLSAYCKIYLDYSLIKEYHEKYHIEECAISYDQEDSYLLEVANEIIENLYNFIICCNLAAPSVLNPYLPFIIFINDINFYHHLSFGHEFHEFIDQKTDLDKKLEILDIPSTWKWLSKQDGFIDGKSSSTNVSRAICSFCNLFNVQPSYLMSHANYFVWSMLGLESLYASGTQGVLQQIKEKTKITLDLEEKHQKLIGKLYNYRSRFFHGQIDLYNPHLFDSLSDETLKLDRESANYHYVAFTLFLLSMQYCAKNDLSELKFEFIQVEN